MSREEKVPIRCFVFCANRTPEAFSPPVPFKFTDQVPASLCESHENEKDETNAAAQRVFSSDIVKSHHIEVLRSRAWLCVTCLKPATDLVHQIVPCWPSPPGTWIMDCAAPICVSAGPCRADAMKILKNVAKTVSGIELSDKRFDFQKFCEVCGKVTGAKMCGGCNIVA